MSLFITGVDTGAGKTYVTAGLVRAACAEGRDCVGLKPICCGGRGDAEILRAAAGDRLALNEVNPLWLRAPAAPFVASMIEGRPIDLAVVRETIAAVGERHSSVLVEGAGGWLVPIARDYSFADLAVELGWPVLVVAINRLGALNHTLLTLESIRARGAVCAGIVLNQPSAPTVQDRLALATNREILEDLTGLLVVELPHRAEVTASEQWSRLYGDRLA